MWRVRLRLRFILMLAPSPALRATSPPRGGEVVAKADHLGTGVGIPTLAATMLHWAKSFSVVAVIASCVALALYPAPLGALAVFMTAVFVTLAILSLITGALGKRRDGWSYSATQAVACVAVMAGAVFLLGEWMLR